MSTGTLLPAARTRSTHGEHMPPDHDDPSFTAAATDLAAERAVLGAAMLDPTALDTCATVLTGTAFYDPRHGQMWHALRTLHASGRPTDPIALLDELRLRGEFKPGQLDGPYLHGVYASILTAAGAEYYAEIVARLARQRRMATLGVRFTQLADRPGLDAHDLDAAYAEAREHLDDIAPATTTTRPTTLEELLAEAGDEDTYDWVIPGLLERHDRLIVTGPEGGGKTTLLRQVGVQVAAGIHPFTGVPIDPVRVLHVDLENSRAQSRRRFRPLRLAAGLSPISDHWVEVRSAGIDLLHLDEHAWLLALVDEVRPDLLLTGPLYRMASGDPTEEKTAKPVSVALDRIRDRGCAVVLEAHSPHATGGSKVRPTRPYGASLWMRWPEFGIHLGEDGTITHWRGGRDEREWPTLLTRGGEWPWTPATDEKQVRWHKIRMIREEFGEFMSIREIAEAAGIARSTVQRLITGKGPYASEWDLLNGPEAGAM